MWSALPTSTPYADLSPVEMLLFIYSCMLKFSMTLHLPSGLLVSYMSTSHCYCICGNPYLFICWLAPELYIYTVFTAMCICKMKTVFPYVRRGLSSICLSPCLWHLCLKAPESRFLRDKIKSQEIWNQHKKYFVFQRDWDTLRMYHPNNWN